MKHHGIKIDPRFIPALLDGTKTMHVERMEPQPHFRTKELYNTKDNIWIAMLRNPLGGLEPYVGFKGAIICLIHPGDVVFLQEE